MKMIKKQQQAAKSVDYIQTEIDSFIDFKLSFDEKSAKFKNLEERFAKYLKNNFFADSTILSYRPSIKIFLAFMIKQDKCLNKADYNTFEDYKEKMAFRSESTACVKISAISTFYDFLARIGEVDRDHQFIKLKKPKVNSSIPRFLSQDEYRRLIAVAKDKNSRAYALVHLGLQTGMRISEMLNLKIEDLILEDKNPYLIIRQSKGKKDRTAPLPSVVLTAIKSYLHDRRKNNSDDPHVFLSARSSKFSDRGLRKLFMSLYTLAGIKNATVHSLRHTFCTHQLRNGTHIKVISSIAGHANLQTTFRYTQICDDDFRKVEENCLV